MSVWSVDADEITLGGSSLNIIFQNNRIKEYLNQNKKFGLSGTKGQGKTFLIKAKRNLLQIKKSDKEVYSDITCFPKDASMVDTLDNTLLAHRSIAKYITTYDIWVQIWKYCIGVTIISSPDCKHFFRENDFKDLSKVTQKIMEVKNINCRPSIILNSLLNLDISEFKAALADNSKIMILLSNVKSGIFVFLDKVDQGFSLELKKIKKSEQHMKIKNWMYSQYSLAQASYDIYANCNHHIKIYYTIRHEVLTEAHNMAPDLSSNIGGYIIELNYSKKDLKDMFDLYIKNENDENLAAPEYKSTNAELAFVGFDTIPNHVYIKDYKESVFDYIYRHSLRRPRDLMNICSEIYMNDSKQIDLTTFRKTINDVSGKELQKYIKEEEPFIELTLKNIEQLLRTLNTNIFDFRYINYVCERVSREYGSNINCTRNCKVCKSAHPFTALYNIGLLGYIYNSTETMYEQRFLNIGESRLKNQNKTLKKSKLYVLHPCLCDIARDSQTSLVREFKTCNETVVGDGITVDEQKVQHIISYLPSLQSQMDKEKVFISSTIEDLLSVRNVIKNSIFVKGLYPIMSEAHNFVEGDNNVDSHDHCINELLRCPQIIYIIGKKCGGKYAGTQYKNLMQEIINQSKNRISNPSISLMEFYAAKKNGIKYHVFVDKQVLDLVSNYNKTKNIDIIKNNEIDEEVINILNFVNHICKDGVRKGNWMIPFTSSSELKKRINFLNFSLDNDEATENVFSCL